jgi:hypothetical protein
MTALNFSAHAAIILNLLAAAAALSLAYKLRHNARTKIRMGGSRPLEGDVATEKSVFGAGRMLQFLFGLSKSLFDSATCD